MLNVRRISASSTRPRAGWPRRSAARGHARRVERARRPAGSTRGRLPVRPPPVMWAIAVHAGLAEQRQHRRARRCGSAPAARRPAAATPGIGSLESSPCGRRRLARERVAVGVQAREASAEHHGRRAPCRAPSMIRLALHHADREAGQVVVAAARRGRASRRSRRRPARSRPARQPSAMPLTTMASTGRGSSCADGEVVEEEQRLGAVHEQVVDAHRDQVDADGVVRGRPRTRP